VLRIKARIETPTGHKDLVRIEEVTIVLGDEALAEIAKVVASQKRFALIIKLLANRQASNNKSL